MAIGATIRRFQIALADADRGVYDELDLRVAQHPSESERYLVARVLARALEHGDGVEFGRGISTDEEPTLWRRDLTGALLAWIEVGAPSVARLHKASKAAPRVAVYAWKADALAAELAAAAIHRADALELFALEPGFLDAIAAGLDRLNRWDLSISGGVLYLGVGGPAGVTHEGALTRVALPARAR